MALTAAQQASVLRNGKILGGGSVLYHFDIRRAPS
jgi:hypothetical protein